MTTMMVVLLAAAQEEWRPIWNGRDLEGWETFLGKPHGGGAASGVDQDPKGVFTVAEVDGRPAIRISGEVWGALTTRSEFENYRFRAQFKWGAKKWPPREKAVRDNGLLYHCIGAHGAQSGFWMKSFEMQIQERDCGDFHSLVGAMVDVEADPGPGGDWVYRAGAPLRTGVAKRIRRDADHEIAGAWNTVEFICEGATATHLVNGKVNLVLRNLRHKVTGAEVPLTRGRIQIQSEGAEIFWRDLAVLPLRPPVRE
jgi:hypothetical protein